MLSFQDAAPWLGHDGSSPFASVGDFDRQVFAEPHGLVFRAGDRKSSVFRIESGAVELEWFLGDGSIGCIESLGPGQMFGVGFRDHYIANAVVVEPSRISWWRREDLTPSFRDTPTMREREVIETTREFEHRKALVLSGRSKQVCRRIAGFICLVRQLNEREGRDSCRIDEAMDPFAVASLLQIDVETLERGLGVLERLGLVTLEGPGSLRICEVGRLYSFVNDQTNETDGYATAMAIVPSQHP